MSDRDWVEAILRMHERWARESDIYHDMLPNYVAEVLTNAEDALARQDDAADSTEPLRVDAHGVPRAWAGTPQPVAETCIHCGFTRVECERDRREGSHGRRQNPHDFTPEEPIQPAAGRDRVEAIIDELLMEVPPEEYMRSTALRDIVALITEQRAEAVTEFGREQAAKGRAMGPMT